MNNQIKEKMLESIFTNAEEYKRVLQEAVLIECPTHDNFSDVCGALAQMDCLRIFNSRHESIYQHRRGYICVRLVKK